MPASLGVYPQVPTISPPLPIRTPVRKPAVDFAPRMTNLGGQPMAPTPLQAPNLPAVPGAPTPTPYGNFTAPDPSQLLNDPAVQFRLEQANKGANRSAAARGTLFSGGFQTALAKLNQGLASEEYDKLFGRSLSAYETNRGTNAQNFGQSLGAFGAQQAVYGDERDNALTRTGVANANSQAQDAFRQQMEDYRAQVQAQREADVARMNAATEAIGPPPPRRPLFGSNRTHLGG